ncbi:MAG: insulinase family protein, partial [Gemmatimonadota bacterium]|nr:insulinase family protein [Gemmatimonadota bacterium]
MTVVKSFSATAAALILCAGTAPTATAQARAPRELIPVEQFTLANGMKVIFHVDRSDPVVAVALNAHVGSSREVTGRTGFAHLFEHLFFLDSENLGKGGLDAM